MRGIAKSACRELKESSAHNSTHYCQQHTATAAQQQCQAVPAARVPQQQQRAITFSNPPRFTRLLPVVTMQLLVKGVLPLSQHSRHSLVRSSRVWRVLSALP